MKFLLWLKRNIWTVLVAVVAALGAGIFCSYYKGKIRSLEVQSAVEKAHKKVAALDAERTAIEEMRIINAGRIESIEKEKKQIQKETVILEKDVKGMSNEEIEYAFQDMY